MKILYLITGLGMGGAERQVCDLADHFASQGDEVMIIYLTGPAIVTPTHPSIHIRGMAMAKTPWSLLSTYGRLRKLITAFAPDVLHSHMVHANLFARFLRFCTPIPRLICTAHSVNEGGALRMLLYRLTDPLADLSTNVSRKAVEAFIQKGAAPEGRMIPFYNGISTQNFFFDEEARHQWREEGGAVETSLVILCVGRLVPEKGYTTMIEAFATLHRHHPHALLWIVGDGPQHTTLQEQCHDLAITDAVTFWGIRRDVPALMSACDIFCLPSHYEGFGLVVAEAMACERYVVATDCGGVAEVVGDHGRLVPPQDPTALALALIDTADLSTQEREVTGHLARRSIIDTYDLATLATQWRTLYTTPDKGTS